MEIGKKLLKARQAAGLSQRQLCGTEITRNMLSQIEHGTANPSMKTLVYLAGQLGLPVSYFLDPQPAADSDAENMLRALNQAEAAIAQGRYPYGRELLEGVDHPELNRRKLLLLARIPGTELSRICDALPDLDEELLLRARAALEAGNPERCRRILEAAEDREAPLWQLVWGKAAMAQGDHLAAFQALQKAEQDHPEVCVPLLEVCCRELGDFKQAYFYACKQKK